MITCLQPKRPTLAVNNSAAPLSLAEPSCHPVFHGGNLRRLPESVTKCSLGAKSSYTFDPAVTHPACWGYTIDTPSTKPKL